MENRDRNVINKRVILIAAVFVLAFVACLLRALKGFCWTDETFYISTTDRFFRGDALIKAEWYRTQMSSLICLPFYALYVTISGSTAGVIIFFRVLYLILSFGTAIVAFHVFTKEYGDTVAIIISLLIMFYAHLNITSLSYYMLSLENLILAGVLVYDYLLTDKKKELIIGGVFFALSVLSLPTMAIPYFIAVVLVAVILLVRQFVPIPSAWKEAIDNAKLGSILIYTFAGICIPAVLVVIYLLCSVSIGDIIASVPYVLVDNEHDFIFMDSFRKFFTSITEVYGRYTYAAYFLMGLTFVFQKLLKKKPISDIIVLLDAMLFVILAIKSYGHTSYIQVAFSMFAMPVFFLSEKKNHKLFWIFSVTGVVLGLVYRLSSSDFLYVMAIGFFITALSGVCFVYDYFKAGVSSDAKAVVNIYKLAATVAMLVIVYTVCVTIALRMSNVYRDAPINRLTHKITQGPGKGLYTTPEHLEMYENVMDIIDEYINNGDVAADSTVMFSKILPWGYLYSNKRCGFPTTWRATAYNQDQLEAYYSINPNREPDIIVVLNEEYGSYDASGDVEDDHNPNLDEMNDYWKNYISSNKMTAIKTQCGTIYMMPNP